MRNIYHVVPAEDKAALIAARQARANNRPVIKGVDRDAVTSADYHTLHELMIDDSVTN